MPESHDGGSKNGRPHVWGFASVILAATIGAMATIVVGVQKGKYDDNRHDLEGQIQSLVAGQAKDRARINELTSQLLAARAGQETVGSSGPGAASDHPTAAGSSPDPGASDARVQRAENYQFTLEQCERQGSDLVCWIKARNDAEDRELRVTEASRAIADDGTPYESSSRILGSRDIANFDLFVDLPTGVPTRFGLRFKGLATKVRHLSLLEMSAQGFHVQWRDVVVS
jgi:hypothetical protein